MNIAGKTANLYLSTPDNVTLGAWFVLSDQYHQTLRTLSPTTPASPTQANIKEAVRQFPTILFLHGAAATRAVAWRVATYSSFTSRLNANVFAIDYRGYGDSTGSPDQEGLVLDAYTAWTWLLEHGAKQEDILIVGHSLGTGVSAQLAKILAAEGQNPRGVVLLAPFSTLSKVVETYPVFGVPILQPLQSFPLGISQYTMYFPRSSPPLRLYANQRY